MKSSISRDEVSLKLKYLNSYDYIFNPRHLFFIWKVAILDLGKAYLFQTTTVNPLKK